MSEQEHEREEEEEQPEPESEPVKKGEKPKPELKLAKKKEAAPKEPTVIKPAKPAQPGKVSTSVKPGCCPDTCNNDCWNLYLGCQPAFSENNPGLAIANCIICGSGLCCAASCGSELPKGPLVCAGVCQFLTAFVGVGIVFSVMAGLAMIAEDSCW